MRRAARVDANSDEITTCLLKLGADVRDTHMVGRGYPDLTVGWCGRTILIEIVGADASPRSLQAHRDRRSGWKGGEWLIVTGRDDLLRQLGVEVNA